MRIISNERIFDELKTLKINFCKKLTEKGLSKLDELTEIRENLIELEGKELSFLYKDIIKLYSKKNW